MFEALDKHLVLSVLNRMCWKTVLKICFRWSGNADFYLGQEARKSMFHFGVFLKLPSDLFSLLIMRIADRNQVSIAYYEVVSTSAAGSDATLHFFILLYLCCTGILYVFSWHIFNFSITTIPDIKVMYTRATLEENGITFAFIPVGSLKC